MNNKIKIIVGKFDNINKMVKELTNEKIELGELMNSLDLKDKLDLTMEEYDLLINYTSYLELNDEQVKELMDLNSIFHNKLNYIRECNDKIILTKENINKNLITYVMQKKVNNDDKNNIIINVNLIGDNQLTLDMIKKEKERG